jgi:hypothetical protein
MNDKVRRDERRANLCPAEVDGEDGPFGWMLHDDEF